MAKLHDFEHNADPPPIGVGIVNILDHSTWITMSMVRKGLLENGPCGGDTPRGKDSFVAVSWEKAVELIASELQRVMVKHSNQAIFSSSYG